MLVDNFFGLGFTSSTRCIGGIVGEGFCVLRLLSQPLTLSVTGFKRGGKRKGVAWGLLIGERYRLYRWREGAWRGFEGQMRCAGKKNPRKPEGLRGEVAVCLIT